VEPLTASFRVLRYDRRGHGRSGRSSGIASRRQHEDDLVALIEQVHGEPAYVVGNSYGGVISLGLAARRPELVRAVTVHEPPIVSVAEGGERGRDAESATDLDLDALASFGGPLLLTEGSAGPPVFKHVVGRLAELLPNAGSASVIGAGHAPHLSHPAAYAQLVTTFHGNAAARDLVASIEG
jgi:pimeloyl-ACP methyl ester carboxylesterase